MAFSAVISMLKNEKLTHLIAQIVQPEVYSIYIREGVGHKSSSPSRTHTRTSIANFFSNLDYI